MRPEQWREEHHEHINAHYDNYQGAREDRTSMITLASKKVESQFKAMNLSAKNGEEAQELLKMRNQNLQKQSLTDKPKGALQQPSALSPQRANNEADLASASPAKKRAAMENKVAEANTDTDLKLQQLELVRARNEEKLRLISQEQERLNALAIQLTAETIRQANEVNLG